MISGIELVKKIAFSQLSTSTLLTKLDLTTNSWCQRWQLFCLSRQQANCYHQMCNQMLLFWSAVFFFRGATCSLFSQRLPTPYVPMCVSLSRTGDVVKKLSIATVDPLVRSHFSIISRTTPGRCPNLVSLKSVSFPQSPSAQRRYPSDQHKHQSLNPNCMGFPLIKCLVRCLLFSKLKLFAGTNLLKFVFRISKKGLTLQQ